MSDIEQLVLSVVDQDIAAHFENFKTGEFALSLPIQIHCCRYLKKISDQLSFKHETGSGNSSDNNDSLPVFEIMNKTAHIKICKNGKVEGFDGKTIIINRIPTLMAQASICQHDSSPKTKASISSSDGALQGTET